MYNIKEIDKIHIKFCKHILGGRQRTPNIAVLGELGRIPLSELVKERALRYWLKVRKIPKMPKPYEQITDGNPIGVNL